MSWPAHFIADDRPTFAEGDRLSPKILGLSGIKNDLLHILDPRWTNEDVRFHSCCCLLLALIMMCAGRMDSSRWRFHSFIHSLRLARYSSVVISQLTPSMASWIINRCQHCCSCETGCTYNQSISPPSSVAITGLDEDGRYTRQAAYLLVAPCLLIIRDGY